MKRIYIVMSYTGSLPSVFIKIFTKCQYSHVSISLNQSLTEMYSFGRKYPKFPIPGAFIKESITSGLFIKKQTKILVKEIVISEAQYIKLKNFITNFNVNQVFYDYIGAIGIKFNKNYFSPNGYVCSSFVNEALHYIQPQGLSSDWNTLPQEFNTAISGKIIYEGYARDYLIN